MVLGSIDPTDCRCAYTEHERPIVAGTDLLKRVVVDVISLYFVLAD